MPEICNLFSTDTIVITPNQRLTQHLMASWMKTQDNDVVTKPNCLSLNIFVHQLLTQVIEQTSQSHPILISSLAATRLWQKLILEHSAFNPSIALAEKLYQAWSLCLAYQCPITDEDFAYNHQTQWFAKLSVAFKQILDQQDLMTEAQLLTYLCQFAIEPPCQRVILFCFDQLTLQQKSFLIWLESLGVAVEHKDLEHNETSNAHQVVTEDSQKEQEAWINWLKQQITQGYQNIAVILPNLQTQANDIQRQLRYHFKPDQYNISMGQSLTEYPMISHALVFLKSLGKTLSGHDIRVYLSSPYLTGSLNEWLNRANLLETNRPLKQACIPKKLWMSFIETRSPKLYEALSNLLPYPQKAKPSEWAKHFHQRLNHLGFPGEYGLTSTLYQCYDKWQASLEAFAQLDRVESALNIDDALTLFQALLSRSIFQPQSAATPIQILGMLEASGCEFDALWIAGLTDLTLPANGQTNPFIPLPIQQERQMPYASKEKEYRLAQIQMQRFLKCTKSITVSYAHLTDDKPNMASPLISNFKQKPPPQVEKQKPESERWQTYQDPSFIPLQTGESIRGGSRILANQAQCPFKAFAAHRLAIQDSDKAVDGLDNREKGTLIHLILQTIWQTIESQERLLTLTDTELDPIIQDAISQSVKQVFNTPQADLNKAILTLERTKLTRLINQVLQEEKRRPPFTVHAVEQSCQYDFAQFSVKLKFDRLDMINEDGSKWIIDYKSTMPGGSPWTDERPDDSQLLLYALLDDDIRTMSYMQIQTGHIKHRGFSEQPPAIKGISAAKKKTWAEYRMQWQSIVADLATEFAQGLIQPKPKKAATCQMCPYGQLCRFPMTTEAGEEE